LGVRRWIFTGIELFVPGNFCALGASALADNIEHELRMMKLAAGVRTAFVHPERPTQASEIASTK
jgi:hypothetical protein